ncbi:MAG: hypothetical protein KC417_14930 [Myxococcales bacterium]|nr:hypothetical protein [Myxococcales bacterium]
MRRLLSVCRVLACVGVATVVTAPAFAAPEVVDSDGDVGWTPRVVLDPSGEPIVSYYDRT